MKEDESNRVRPLEVLIFRRPHPEVLDALARARDRDGECRAICVLPGTKASANVRVFWDCHVHPEYPSVPLTIAHDSETPIAELLEQLGDILADKHPHRPIKFLLIADSAGSWGTLRLSFLAKKLKRRLDISVHRSDGSHGMRRLSQNGVA